jgi:hypothetical protein
MLALSSYRYRGRSLTETDIGSIRDLIANNTSASRRALSALLCDAWNWKQPNGHRCDMIARGMMLDLHRRGLIQLPEQRMIPKNPFVTRARPAAVDIDRAPIDGSLAELRPLEFRLVRRTLDEPLFNSLIAQHHYLGYTQPVGEHLKYMVFAKGRPIACLALSSAPRHLAPRDQFIGWSADVRKANLRFLAYNTRYLILPWVKVEHLASHLLGRIARRLSKDWEAVYGHEIFFVETFVDPALYKGTCYRAANWISLGFTTGRGNNSLTWKPTRSLKESLGYPLVADFREKLGRL